MPRRACRRRQRAAAAAGASPRTRGETARRRSCAAAASRSSRPAPAVFRALVPRPRQPWPAARSRARRARYRRRRPARRKRRRAAKACVPDDGGASRSRRPPQIAVEIETHFEDGIVFRAARAARRPRANLDVVEEQEGGGRFKVVEHALQRRRVHGDLTADGNPPERAVLPRRKDLRAAQLAMRRLDRGFDAVLQLRRRQRAVRALHEADGGSLVLLEARELGAQPGEVAAGVTRVLERRAILPGPAAPLPLAI